MYTRARVWVCSVQVIVDEIGHTTVILYELWNSTLTGGLYSARHRILRFNCPYKANTYRREVYFCSKNKYCTRCSVNTVIYRKICKLRFNSWPCINLNYFFKYNSKSLITIFMNKKLDIFIIYLYLKKEYWTSLSTLMWKPRSYYLYISVIIKTCLYSV